MSLFDSSSYFSKENTPSNEPATSETLKLSSTKKSPTPTIEQVTSVVEEQSNPINSPNPKTELLDSENNYAS